MTIADVQPTTGRALRRHLEPQHRRRHSRLHRTAFPPTSPAPPTSPPAPTASPAIRCPSSSIRSSPASCWAVHRSNCTTDPTTACCPLTTVGSLTAPPYLANSCLSQGTTAQLVARVYAGTGANQTNISCQAGHLQYSAQGALSSTAISPVVSIDQNGVATANQPGSVLITANIADAASSAGFFSTCPPATITLTAPGTTTNPVVINQNNAQPLIATAVDTNGVALTGLSLEYVSTSPTTIPGGRQDRSRPSSRVPPLSPQSASRPPAISPPTTRSASSATASRSSPTPSTSPLPEPTAPSSTWPARSPVTSSPATSLRTRSPLLSCCPSPPTPCSSPTTAQPSTWAAPPP